MTTTREPERGDLIEVSWVDIVEACVDNPDDAALARRLTVGYFWAHKDDRGVPVLVTTATKDTDGHEQSGYCVYPRACVTAVRVIKRARRARKKAAPAVPAPPAVPPVPASAPVPRSAR